MQYTETTLTPNIPWRATTRASTHKQAGRLSKSNVSPVGNGATNYGEVKAGTILARDSNGLLHPLGCAKVAVAPSASNDVEVDNANLFFVGDIVSIRSGSNKTKAITNNSVVISIKAKIQGLSLDIVVSGTSTTQKTVYDPVTKTITFTSATDVGGAATSTHADLVSELLKFASLIESASSATPATLVADQGPTALESAKYGGIATARTITAIDGAVLTLSGGAFTAAVDDIVLKDGAYKPVGILDETVSTVRYVGTTAVVADQNVTVAYEGDARDSSSFVPNLCAGNAGAVVKRALSGHPYVDPGVDPTTAAPTEITPTEQVGFRFRSV